ncbi:hypothetical protein GW915_10785 [bacterium]|nr:hypothetical protein [bacterium]
MKRILDDFFSIARKQWNLGWARGIEAFNALKNEDPLAHIRKTVEQQLRERQEERDGESTPSLAKKSN